MRPDSQIKDSDRVRCSVGIKKRASSLAFVQSDHKNLFLVNNVYLTPQKSSELKQLVKQSFVTKPLCDLPDLDLKRYV